MFKQRQTPTHLCVCMLRSGLMDPRLNQSDTCSSNAVVIAHSRAAAACFNPPPRAPAPRAAYSHPVHHLHLHATHVWRFPEGVVILHISFVAVVAVLLPVLPLAVPLPLNKASERPRYQKPADRGGVGVQAPRHHASCSCLCRQIRAPPSALRAPPSLGGPRGLLGTPPQPSLRPRPPFSRPGAPGGTCRAALQ